MGINRCTDELEQADVDEKGKRKAAASQVVHLLS